MQIPQPTQPAMQPLAGRIPLARWNTRCGVWETIQPDLYGRLARYSAIWPTVGMTRNGSVYQLQPSELPITGSASSSSPGAPALFRTPLASDSSRGGESLDQVKARRGTIALSHQIIDFALHGPAGSPARHNASQTLFTLIETIFDAGDDTPPPSPDGNTSPDETPRPQH